jgi:hypothetical protein
MAPMNVTDSRCEALFASELQRSDALTPDAVAAAISTALSSLGLGGCASRLAQEYGDHPESARERMQWVRQIVGELSA